MKEFEMGDNTKAFFAGKIPDGINDEDMKAGADMVKRIGDEIYDRFKDNPDMERAVSCAIPFYLAGRVLKEEHDVEKMMDILISVKTQSEIFLIFHTPMIKQIILEPKNSKIGMEFMKFMLSKND